jgi:hypothetical protein
MEEVDSKRRPHLSGKIRRRRQSKKKDCLEKNKFKNRQTAVGLLNECIPNEPTELSSASSTLQMQYP